MRKKDYTKILIMFFIGILYLLFILKYNIGIPCIFHKLTGFYCPGCGTTRAIISLIKFNPYQALRYNMLTIFLIPLASLYCIYKYILNGKKEIPNWVWFILLAITIIFFILRNIPAFSFLAPMEFTL